MRRTRIRKRQRVTLAEGVYQDAYGIAAIAKVGSGDMQRIRSKRFPLTTALSTVIAWRLHALAELVDVGPARVIPLRGSLAADLPNFLKLIPAGRRRDDFELLLAHWAASPLGETPRGEIRREAILEQLAQWENEGAAVVTLNHRLRALRRFYGLLDGEDVPNPTDKIHNRPVLAPEVRGFPIELGEFILGAMPDRGRGERGECRPTVSHTKIRLRCLAWTGMPHMQLERLRPHDVDLAHARLHLRPRRKGKGSKGVWLNLIPPAVDALRDFGTANLWGKSFSRSSIRKSWTCAIRRATAAAVRTGNAEMRGLLEQLPPDCRPYDLRHSFLTEAYRLTGDLRAVKELAQHADIKTTERYTQGAVSERAAAASAALGARWQHPAPPAAAPKRRPSSLRLVGTTPPA